MLKKLLLLTLFIPLSVLANISSEIRLLAADISDLIPQQTIYQCQYVLNSASSYAVKSAERLDKLDKIMAKSYLTLTMTQLELAQYQQCQQADKIEQLKFCAQDLIYKI